MVMVHLVSSFSRDLMLPADSGNALFSTYTQTIYFHSAMCKSVMFCRGLYPPVINFMHSVALQHRPVIATSNHRVELCTNSCLVGPSHKGGASDRGNVNNMPETSKETETEAGLGESQQRDRGTQAAHNVVSLISQIVDDHLTLVRSLSTGLAIVGVVVIARSIKLITKFKAASEIPAHFIERNVSLRGKVQSVTENGLEVEHMPIYLPVLSPLLSKHKGVSMSPLLVRLAGVELTQEGKLWLQKHLAPAQTVRLKLVSREEDILHCLVYQSSGALWSYSVNEEVLKLGLARTAPIALLPSPLFWRLHKQLHRAEVKAERKGRGLWKEDRLWERAAKTIRDSYFYKLMKRTFKRT